MWQRRVPFCIRYFSISNIAVVVLYLMLIYLTFFTSMTLLRNGTTPEVTGVPQHGYTTQSSLSELELCADLLRNEIQKLQTPVNCSTQETFLQCGHWNTGCGMGCQIHHRILCLVVSYVLKMPLVHDESNWSYNQPWGSVFMPLGSSCPLGSNYITIMWDSSGPMLWRVNANKADRLKFSLENGIYVSESMAENIERLHQYPANWLLAQFMQIGLQLTPSMKQKLIRAKELLNWSSPVVGLHVRRTDKISEAKDSAHDLAIYMEQATKYFEENNYTSGTKQVFIASDEPEVIHSAKKTYKFPEWQIMGFELNSSKAREDTLEETVLDLFLLTESDFVVCGYSSNICRLVQEMMFTNHEDAFQRLHSLDGIYNYLITGIIVNLTLSHTQTELENILTA